MCVSDRGAGSAATFPSRLFHYTDEAGFEGIGKTGVLHASLQTGPRGDAFYGDGQYFTDIAPGRMSREDIAYIIYRDPQQEFRLTHCLEIHTQGLDITFAREHIYRVPGSTDLKISSRRIYLGKIY